MTGYYLNRRMPEQPVSFSTTLGAAFRQENDVVNMAQMLTRERHDFDPNFRLLDRVEQLPDRTVWERHSQTLVRAQSEAEFTDLLARIQQEENDRQLLASQGWSGIAAQLIAGTLSPTMLIPLVGPAARGVSGARQAFMLGAAAGTAAEVPLFLNQLTRTPEELAMGIAASTVLGGILGSAAVALRRQDFERIARELDPEAEVVARALVRMRRDGGMERVGEAVQLRIQEPIPELPTMRLEDIPDMPVEPGVFYHITTRSRAADIQLEGLRPHSPDFGTDQLAWPDGSETPRIYGSDTPRQTIPFASPDDSPVILRVQAESGRERGTGDRIVETEVGPERIQYYDPERGSWRDLNPTAAQEAAAARAEPSTAGARETQARDVPLERIIDPETGAVRFEPVIPEAQRTQMVAAGFIGEIAGRINPVMRAAMQWGQPIRSAVAARHMLRLSDGGISWQGAKHGLAPSPDGTVEARMQYYRALQARAYSALYDGYVSYTLEGMPVSKAARAEMSARIEFDRPRQGKMSFSEFSEALVNAMNKGDKSPIPQIESIANEWRNSVFTPVVSAAREAADLWGSKSLFKVMEFDEDEALSYMTHQYSPRAIAENQLGFIEMVAQHVRDAAAATWERRITRMRRAETRDRELAELLSLDQEEARRLFDNNLAMIRDLKEEADPRLAQASRTRLEAESELEEEFENLLRGRDEGTITGTNDELWERAKESTAEIREALLAEADRIEAQVPKELLEKSDAVRALRRMNRQIARSFGRLEERQAAALKQIERNEELNLAAFSRVVSATQRMLRDMNSVSDEVLEKQLEQLQASWDRAWKAASRGEAKLDKLEENLLFGNYTGKGALEESMRQTGRQQRADRAFDRLTKAMLADRAALRAEVQSRLDGAIAYTNRVNNSRAERNALLRQKIEALDPAQALREANRLVNRWDARWDDLDQRAWKAGGQGTGRTGSYNFAESARDYATELANKIMGNNARIAEIDAAAGIRSPMRMRLLKIPYEKKKQFLDMNAEKVLDRYLRTMGSDIELYRAFGDRSGSKAIIDVLEDMQRIREHLQSRVKDEDGKTISASRRQKELDAHDKATRKRKEEFEATIERIRSLRGIPDNPNAMPYRLGKFFINLNVATMMGSAMITSIPDAGRSVMAHGMTRTFRDGWAPFIRGLVSSADKPLSRELKEQLQLLGIGVDVFTQQRARNMFDMLEPSAHSTAVERGVEYMASKMPTVAMFGLWTDAMKTLTGAASMSRLVSGIRAAAAGTISATELRYLADAGIDRAMIPRIAYELENTGTKYERLVLPNVEDWTDYGAMRAFSAAMAREDARLVITPGLERPLWMDGSMMGRLVGQFRSFTMAANSKMMIAALQSRDMAAIHALQGTIFSLALGTISYYAWAMTAGESQREEMRNASWQVWLDQAIYRSGILGGFSEVQAIGQEFSAVRPFVRFSDRELAGRRANNALGAIAGPTFGTLENVMSVLQGIDDPTQSTLAQARKLVPYQNVFWLRSGLDQVEAAMAERLGLPERRQAQ